MTSRLYGFAHRQIWQRLPQGPRRALFGWVTRRLAPRPAGNIPAALPIIVAGVLRSTSGLGQSARACHRALASAGLPVFGVDLTSQLRQPTDTDFVFRDGTGLSGPATLILHVNAPLVPFVLAALPRGFLDRKRIVGYWAWELPRAPAEWRTAGRYVHEVWVPSLFTANAVRDIGPPVHVLPHPLTAPDERPPRKAGRPFTVLTVFDMASSFARKNPLAAIRSFRTAFGDDAAARLVVKFSNGGVYPEGVALLEREKGDVANVELRGETLTRTAMDALYAEADVVLSLHRSEGFGLVIAEAMLRGLPVVATDWSGSQDFLTPETGFPVPAMLVPARDPQGTYDLPAETWAEPDIDAAASLLRRIRAEPNLASAVGNRAATLVRLQLSPESYVASVRRYLGI